MAQYNAAAAKSAKKAARLSAKAAHAHAAITSAWLAATEVEKDALKDAEVFAAADHAEAPLYYFAAGRADHFSTYAAEVAAACVKYVKEAAEMYERAKAGK